MSYFEHSYASTISQEAIEYLDKGKHVYIEDGCLNDQIISYRIEEVDIPPYWMHLKVKRVTFTTSACVFPKEISLHNFEHVDSEEFEGNLFIKV